MGGWVGGLSAVFVYRSRLAGVCLCVDAQAIVEMLFLHSGRDDVRSTFSSKISFFFFFFIYLFIGGRVWFVIGLCVETAVGVEDGFGFITLAWNK